jgi:hypothetical protein
MIRCIVMWPCCEQHILCKQNVDSFKANIAAELLLNRRCVLVINMGSDVSGHLWGDTYSPRPFLLCDAAVKQAHSKFPVGLNKPVQACVVLSLMHNLAHCTVISCGQSNLHTE